MLKSFLSAIVAAYMAFVGAFQGEVHVNNAQRAANSASVLGATSTLKLGEKEATSTAVDTLNSATTNTKYSQPQSKSPSTLPSRANNPDTPAQIVTTPAAEDFSLAAIALIDDLLEYTESFKQLLRDYRSIPSERATTMRDLIGINNQFIQASSDSTMNNVFGVLNGAYEKDAKNAEARVAAFDSLLKYLDDKYVNPWKASKQSITGGSKVSREQFTATTENIKGYFNGFDQMADAVESGNASYNQYIKTQDATYASAFDMIEAHLSSASTYHAPTPVYLPVILPPPPAPKVVNCYGQNYSSSMTMVDCYSW